MRPTGTQKMVIKISTKNMYSTGGNFLLENEYLQKFLPFWEPGEKFAY
jgi:hypothetical protein